MDLNKLKECLNNLSDESIDKLNKLVMSKGKTIILGNGGSNSIASHISQDYTKFLNRKAISFSDPSRLTCYINDFGMENAYKVFLEQFVDDDTLVILISSSGNSPNILNSAEYCVGKCPFVILSGFSIDNKLKNNYESHSSLSFYVDSDSYGIVENMHQIILHSIL